MIDPDYISLVAAEARRRYDLVEEVEEAALAPDVMQQKLLVWQSENFGLPSDEQITLGVGEEVSETFDADTIGELIDGIGDTMVYAGQLLGRNRLAISGVLAIADHYRRQFGRTVEVAEIAKHALLEVGKLNHLVLKTAQKIRVGTAGHDVYRERLVEHLGRCIGITQLHCLANMMVAGAADLSAVYIRVGAEVLARDWKKNTATGEAV